MHASSPPLVTITYRNFNLCPHCDFRGGQSLLCRLCEGIPMISLKDISLVSGRLSCAIPCRESLRQHSEHFGVFLVFPRPGRRVPLFDGGDPS